jgi:hypothetical protein
MAQAKGKSFGEHQLEMLLEDRSELRDIIARNVEILPGIPKPAVPRAQHWHDLTAACAFAVIAFCGNRSVSIAARLRRLRLAAKRRLNVG